MDGESQSCQTIKYTAIRLRPSEWTFKGHSNCDKPTAENPHKLISVSLSMLPTKLVSCPTLVNGLTNFTAMPHVLPIERELPPSADDITYHLQPSVSSSCQLTHSHFYCAVSGDPILNALSTSCARYNWLTSFTTVFQRCDNIMELLKRIITKLYSPPRECEFHFHSFDVDIYHVGGHFRQTYRAHTLGITCWRRAAGEGHMWKNLFGLEEQ